MGSMPVPTSISTLDAFAATLRSQGHEIAILEVPPAVYATFYPGAEEMAQMMGYWVAHTYLGPDSEEQIAAGRRVSTSAPTEFATWAATHMVAAGQGS